MASPRLCALTEGEIGELCREIMRSRCTNKLAGMSYQFSYAEVEFHLISYCQL